jgi:hypothetical protein
MNVLEHAFDLISVTQQTDLALTLLGELDGALQKL